MSPTTPPLHLFEKTLGITNSTYKGLQRTLLIKIEKQFNILKKYVSNNSINSTTPPVKENIRHHKLHLQRTPIDSIDEI